MKQTNTFIVLRDEKGDYLASYKNNNSGKIIFSPPGAGNLPVRFFFYPEK